MAKVIITKALKEDVLAKFKGNSEKIFVRMKNLESQPKMGKPLGNIGGVLIKEIRYENFRFYFITDGHLLKFGSPEELANLLIKFVKMSGKKDQQKTIDTIKRIIRSMGFDGF
jgi:hypothetical protein